MPPGASGAVVAHTAISVSGKQKVISGVALPVILSGDKRSDVFSGGRLLIAEQG